MKIIFHFYALLWRWLVPNRSNWQKQLTSTPQKTIWFHAASSGELEVLIPLIEAAVANRRPACVSIFSKSAESWLKRLPKELLYCGFSPRDGEWLQAFQHYGVRELVTSKYEAWPGLWAACSLGSIRITVVCAQLRSSLQWAKRLLMVFGIKLPRLRFFVLDEVSLNPLKEYFADSETLLSVDPRWHRVNMRAQQAQDLPALQFWLEKNRSKPKPYWVVGSAWPEDMDFLSAEIQNYPGTVWIVPHSLNPQPDPLVFKPFENCVLVNEMGMLVELYSIAERAWVGGGFGRGIHSTLEPAVYSIPVACGPEQSEKFFETKELQKKGILQICRTAEDLRNWMQVKPPHRLEIDVKVRAIQYLIGEILK